MLERVQNLKEHQDLGVWAELTRKHSASAVAEAEI